VEPTDFRNVFIENIAPALFKIAGMVFEILAIRKTMTIINKN
jgi:hypothetical protein